MKISYRADFPKVCEHKADSEAETAGKCKGE